MKIGIEGEPGLERDMHSKALLSTDRRALQASLTKAQESKQVKDIQRQLNTLQDEFVELKGLILRLINGNTTS